MAEQLEADDGFIGQHENWPGVGAVIADVECAPDFDRRALGGHVTVMLCGAWDHEGTCKWPHLTMWTTERQLRIRYACPASDCAGVRERISDVLQMQKGWRLVAERDDRVGDEDLVWLGRNSGVVGAAVADLAAQRVDELTELATEIALANRAESQTPPIQ